MTSDNKSFDGLLSGTSAFPEKELDRPDEKYFELFRNMADGVFYQSRDGRLTDVNEPALKIFGLTRDQFLAIDFHHHDWQVYDCNGHHLPPDKHPSMVALATGKKILDFELSVFNPLKKETYWLLVDAIPQFFSNHDQTSQVIVILRNNTNNKSVVKALHESEAKYRTFFENAIAGIFQSTPQGKYLSVNPAFARMLGYRSPQELCEMVKDIASEFYVHPETRKEIIKVMAEKGRTSASEIEVKRKDGSLLWVAINAHTVLGENKEILYYEGTCYDITEKKKSEEQLRIKDVALNSAVSGIGLADLEGKIIFANDAFVKMWGYHDSSEILGKKILDFAHSKERATEVITSLKQGIGFIGEGDGIKKDGSIFQVELSANMVVLPNGTPVCMMASFIDISDWKKTYEELRESEEKFRAAFTISPDAISLTSVSDGKYVDVNDGFCEITGFTREEIIGKTAYEINIWENHADRKNIVKILEKYGFANNFEANFNLKNGTTLTGLMSARVFNIHGIPHLVSLTRDISERKKAEIALQLSEQKYRLLAEYSADVIWILNLEGRFTYVSPSIEKLRGYTPEEILHKTIDQTLSPSSAELARNLIIEAFALIEKGVKKLEPAPIVFEQTCKDGSTIWTESLVRPMFDGEGKHTGYLGVTRNISERIHAAEKIRLLNLSLEKRVEERTAELIEANKELEAFAYTVSHDLRAPVRAIGGFTKILQLDFLPQLDEEGQRVFKVILENTHRMEYLIDDLLAFSRLSRTGMNLSTINMAEIIWKCFNELTLPEARDRIHLSVSDLPLVRSDYSMLVQVWTNLLSNAIKYTSHCEHSEIQIECNRFGNELIFSIKDNGTGFDMKYVNKLFGVFQRLHSVKEYEGTGVGLAIVQRIINRHGGRVWAEAEPGKGAKFYFTLNTTS